MTIADRSERRRGRPRRRGSAVDRGGTWSVPVVPRARSGLDAGHGGAGRSPRVRCRSPRMRRRSGRRWSGGSRPMMRASVGPGDRAGPGRRPPSGNGPCASLDGERPLRSAWMQDSLEGSARGRRAGRAGDARWAHGRRVPSGRGRPARCGLEAWRIAGASLAASVLALLVVLPAVVAAAGRRPRRGFATTPQPMAG